MNKLNQNEVNFWNSYLESVPLLDRPDNPFITATPAGTLETTDELITLYQEGIKYAGSSVVEDFKTANDPLPKVGDFWILLNSKNVPTILLLTKKIEINKFRDVPKHVANAEGEGDLSLSYWKKVHSKIYTPYLKEWGIASIDEATIITEYFKTIYP